jgi:hypothetical protein
MAKQLRTKDEWLATFADQRASGLPTAEYCAQHDILVHSFQLSFRT